MSDHVELRRGAYADSVRLLQVSRDVQQVEGVGAAQVAMATPLNVEVLAGMGFVVPADATANDLVVAIRLVAEGALAGTLAAVDAALSRRDRTGVPTGEATAPPRTTATSLRAAPDDAVVVVSVPGPHASVEAMDALDAGYDVMLFSDNVPLAEEVTLKQAAIERGLLVMGPDCGTAVVDGLGLGFANVVAPGPVGIVAASGTGCQQLMCLLDHAGVGVRHALGVGGRDLSAEVAGRSTRTALARLDADPSVALIVLVSKPPADEVATAIREYADRLATPVELALLGPGRPDLTEAAEAVLRRLGSRVPEWPATAPAHTLRAPTGHLLRGLFAGGTLASEARQLAAALLAPGAPRQEVSSSVAALTGEGHAVVDFGDDELTVGRAHPMIDPTLRLEQLARVGGDERTGVVLLDVVLGHGADPDPAALLAPAIAAVSQPVVVTLVGTTADPQDRAHQERALVDAGAEVHLSNAAATRRAIGLLGGDA